MNNSKEEGYLYQLRKWSIRKRGYFWCCEAMVLDGAIRETGHS